MHYCMGPLERYRSGHNGADSKSDGQQCHVGSNPTLSANKNKQLEKYPFRQSSRF